MIEQLKFTIIYMMALLKNKTGKDIYFVIQTMDFVYTTDKNLSSIFSKTTYPLPSTEMDANLTIISYSAFEKSEAGDYISEHLSKQIKNIPKTFATHSKVLSKKYSTFLENSYNSAENSYNFAKNSYNFAKNSYNSAKNSDNSAENSDNSAENSDNFVKQSDNSADKLKIEINKNGSIRKIIYKKEHYLYKVPIEKKSYEFSGNYKKILNSIEVALDKILKNNTEQKNENDVRLFYNKCVQKAKSQNIADLILLENEIPVWINKQKAGHTSSKIKEEKKEHQRLIKKIKRTVILLFLFVSTLIGIFFYARYKVNKMPQEQEQTTVSLFYSEDEIDAFINIYENNNNCKIFEYRRDIIKDSVLNKNISEPRINEIIDSTFLALNNGTTF